VALPVAAQGDIGSPRRDTRSWSTPLVAVLGLTKSLGPDLAVQIETVADPDGDLRLAGSYARRDLHTVSIPRLSGAIGRRARFQIWKRVSTRRPGRHPDPAGLAIQSIPVATGISGAPPAIFGLGLMAEMDGACHEGNPLPGSGNLRAREGGVKVAPPPRHARHSGRHSHNAPTTKPPRVQGAAACR